MTIDNIFKDWVSLNYDTENTRRDILTHMSKYFREYTEYNQVNVNEYLINKLKTVKNSSFNKEVYALKVYGKFAKVDLVYPKVKSINHKVKDYITLEELEETILPMIDMIFDEYEKIDLLIRFMFFTGLRAKEIVSLEKVNIDFEKGIIKVINTKGKVDREVFSLDEKLFSDLQKYTNRLASEKVFNLTYRQIKYALEKVQAEMQLKKKIHPHFFRISFAKHCVRLGINDSIIQKLLGHKDLATTLLYCEPDRNMVQEACQKVKRIN